MVKYYPLRGEGITVARLLARTSMPKPLEPRRIVGGVLDGVLDVPVAEVILNEPLVRDLVGEGEAACMAYHVRMGAKGRGRGGAVFGQAQIDGGAVQRLAPFADKEGAAGRFHPGALFQPARNDPQFVEPERVGCRKPALLTGDMQHAAFAVHLIEFQAAGFRHPQPVPEHQQQ